MYRGEMKKIYLEGGPKEFLILPKRGRWNGNLNSVPYKINPVTATARGGRFFIVMPCISTIFYIT